MYSNQVKESHQRLPGDGMKEDEDRREITKGMEPLGQMGIFIPLIMVIHYKKIGQRRGHLDVRSNKLITVIPIDFQMHPSSHIQTSIQQ